MGHVNTMTEQSVTLSLSSDEALVLFDWLSRFNSSEGRHFDHPAEQRVLWNIEAMLESQLVAPLNPNYREIVSAARDRLVAS